MIKVMMKPAGMMEVETKGAILRMKSS